MKRFLIGAAVATMVVAVVRADGYDEKLLAKCSSFSTEVPVLRRDAVIFEALAKRVKVKKEVVRAFIKSVLSSSRVLKESKEYVPNRGIEIDKFPAEIAAWARKDIKEVGLGAVDLDGDGRLEWIVESLEGGSMWPFHKVLTRKNGSWKSIDVFRGYWFPVKVEGRKGLSLVAVTRICQDVHCYEYYEYNNGKLECLMTCSSENVVKHHFSFYEVLGPAKPRD